MATLSLRDPVHGFIRADGLESALISARPFQRLRFIHQLGLSHLVFPGAEHSRFSHALGAMELAGRVYDSLAAKSEGLLPSSARALERRAIRAAALLHDIGHAPYSHSAEGFFADGIDHEEMTRRLLTLPEVEQAFARHGEGLAPDDIVRLLRRGGSAREQLLSQIISGELDVDKMDYLLRDSLYCGVRYGNYDLDRLLDTMVPLRDPDNGSWGIGVEEGGVHALEALVMARYYMFTQVYFNVTSKALELHLGEWMREQGRRWPAEPPAFLAEDDVTTLAELRRSPSLHARALVDREHFDLAYQTREHLTVAEGHAFEALVRELSTRFDSGRLLVSRSSKDPHRFSESRVLVRRHDGSLEPMAEASHFIAHLKRIEQFRVYTLPSLTQEVAEAIQNGLG
ncbi:MAG TPA: HD domain-containing protein [Thermoanaerobaculia bacterium]|nr:HD domain-containing protein [Thermoanaerobaculia bacterium]